jgi:hypothetical protein
MTGGLIQIVAYGTADIFLTGMPQITFFKLVYRRYTNFAIENLEQTFGGIKNFGNTISCTLDRTGDLVNKMYLKVVIPNVFLANPNYIADYTPQDALEIKSLQSQYSDFKAIINFIYQYYRELNTYINTINNNLNLNNFFNKIIQITNLYYQSPAYNTLKTKYNSTYSKNLLLNQFLPTDTFYDSSGRYLYQGSTFNDIKISDIDIIKIIVNYSISNFKDSNSLLIKLKDELLNYKNNTIKIDKFLFKSIGDYQKLHKNYKNYKFSWIPKLGHQIINNITLDIGGQIIDRHTGDWFNIWNELSLNSEIQPVYDKMIGNIDILTKYDNTSKPSYTMYIPLQFWFNKYIEGSLPLVFLRYHDVKLQIELNQIRNLFYTNAPSDYNFDDGIQLMDISLMTDYIYLDNDERSKFAQSSQEYIIELVQNYNYNNINTSSITNESYFINSVKEMFWVAQSNYTLSNNFYSNYDLGIIYKVSGINYILTTTLERKIQIVMNNHVFNQGDTITIFNSQFYNGDYKIISADISSITIYSLFYVSENDCFVKLKNIAKPILTYGDRNPFINTTYTFEQYNRFFNYDSNFTNYVQPYKYHTKTPSDGINIFSFSLMPEEYQPSGTANLSTYKYKSFQFQLNQKLIDYITKNNDTLIIKTYALGYNILTFKNGMAGLVFNI